MFFHFQINFCSFSAIGNLKIAEIDPGGHFVKILNCAPEKEESIGDYLLKQDVQGQLVAVFQFPPETRMGPNSTVTVSVGGLNAFFQLAD